MVFHSMSGVFPERELGDDFAFMHQVMQTVKDKVAARYFFNALAEDAQMSHEVFRKVFLKSQYKTSWLDCQSKLRKFMSEIVEVRPAREVSVHNLYKREEARCLCPQFIAHLCQFDVGGNKSLAEIEREIRGLTFAAYNLGGIFELAAIMRYFPFLIHFFGNIVALNTKLVDNEGVLWVPVASCDNKKGARLTYRKLNGSIQKESSTTFLVIDHRPF